MIFLGTPSSPLIREAMLTAPIGCMITPAQGMAYPVGTVWAADNGNGPKQDGSFADQFGVGRTLAYERYMAFLAEAAAREGADPCDPETSGCLFATAPDLYCDAPGTLSRAEVPYPMLRIIREVIGVPAAFVAQDGMRPRYLPWDDLDVLFVGGSKRWKASDDARLLLREAQRRGKGTHLGRVNTLQWLKFAADEGYDTCDGTTFTRGGDKNLRLMLRWLARVNAQSALW